MDVIKYYDIFEYFFNKINNIEQTIDIPKNVKHIFDKIEDNFSIFWDENVLPQILNMYPTEQNIDIHNFLKNVYLTRKVYTALTNNQMYDNMNTSIHNKIILNNYGIDNIDILSPDKIQDFAKNVIHLYKNMGLLDTFKSVLQYLKNTNFNIFNLSLNKSDDVISFIMNDEYYKSTLPYEIVDQIPEWFLTKDSLLNKDDFLIKTDLFLFQYEMHQSRLNVEYLNNIIELQSKHYNNESFEKFKKDIVFDNECFSVLELYLVYMHLSNIIYSDSYLQNMNHDIYDMKFDLTEETYASKYHQQTFINNYYDVYKFYNQKNNTYSHIYDYYEHTMNNNLLSNPLLNKNDIILKKWNNKNIDRYLKYDEEIHIMKRKNIYSENYNESNLEKNIHYKLFKSEITNIDDFNLNKITDNFWNDKFDYSTFENEHYFIFMGGIDSDYILSKEYKQNNKLFNRNISGFNLSYQKDIKLKSDVYLDSDIKYDKRIYKQNDTTHASKEYYTDFVKDVDIINDINNDYFTKYQNKSIQNSLNNRYIYIINKKEKTIDTILMSKSKQYQSIILLNNKYLLLIGGIETYQNGFTYITNIPYYDIETHEKNYIDLNIMENILKPIVYYDEVKNIVVIKNGYSIDQNDNWITNNKKISIDVSSFFTTNINNLPIYIDEINNETYDNFERLYENYYLINDDIIDIITNNAIVSLPSGLSGYHKFNSFIYNNRLIIFGGILRNEIKFNTYVYEYSFDENIWSVLNDIPYMVQNNLTFYINNELYIFSPILRELNKIYIQNDVCYKMVFSNKTTREYYMKESKMDFIVPMNDSYNIDYDNFEISLNVNNNNNNIFETSRDEILNIQNKIKNEYTSHMKDKLLNIYSKILNTNSENEILNIENLFMNIESIVKNDFSSIYNKVRNMTLLEQKEYYLNINKQLNSFIKNITNINSDFNKINNSNNKDVIEFLKNFSYIYQLFIDYGNIATIKDYPNDILTICDGIKKSIDKRKDDYINIYDSIEIEY